MATVRGLKSMGGLCLKVKGVPVFVLYVMIFSVYK